MIGSRFGRWLLLTGSCWAVAAWLLGPSLIARVHGGELLPFVESALGLSEWPLEKVLAHWSLVHPRVTAVWLGAALVVWLAGRRRFRERVDAVLPPARPYPDTPRLAGRRRRVVAAATIGAVVAGQGVDTVIDREHWPFSNYPMYVGIQDRAYEPYRVLGVAGDGEISLSKYLLPYTSCRISARIQMHGGRTPEEHVRKCAECFLEWYERARVLGRHGGPPISAVRIYRFRFEMRRDAANRDTPDGRTLLAEAWK